MQDNSGKTAWDRIREVAGLKHLSLRTEQAYVQWVRRFWIFVRKRNLRSVGVEEIGAFLTHLAVGGYFDARVKRRDHGNRLCGPLFETRFCHLEVCRCLVRDAQLHLDSGCEVVACRFGSRGILDRWINSDCCRSNISWRDELQSQNIYCGVFDVLVSGTQ